MIAQGYLCEVVPKRTATQLDTTQVGSRGGEFIAGQLEAAVDIEAVTESAVDEIVRHGDDRGSWLVFCAGVRHAEHVRDAIRSRGFSCEAVLGETASAERDRMIAAFKRGDIRCLTTPTC
jgi:DNA repair protein RadD